MPRATRSRLTPLREALTALIEGGYCLCVADNHDDGCPILMLPKVIEVLDGIVSDDLTVAELCETHAKLCGGTWPGCAKVHA